MPTEIEIHLYSAPLERKSIQITFLDILRYAMSFRTPMTVRELLVFRSFFGETGYYRCPRCGITVEREFMAYCDRCGQRLDWHQYRKATVIVVEPKGRI